MKYIFYEDPGHGWLKVKRKELIELGLENEISTCSYQLGNSVYLEEDGDCTRFINAWEKKNKKAFETKTMVDRHITNRSSRIRNYDSYQATELIGS